MPRSDHTLTDETGAEAVEFALVFPVAMFLLLGLLYGLIAVAAHVSLAHAASRAVRYAAIATDPVTDVYPSVEDVERRLDDETPFFTASACDTTLDGSSTENAPVTLDTHCAFPNPFGRALHALRNLISRSDDPDASGDSLQVSAHAEARRE